jgi:hypothetical protein
MLCSPLVLHSTTLRPFVGNSTICDLTYRLETDLELMVHEVFHAMGAVRILPCYMSFQSSRFLAYSFENCTRVRCIEGWNDVRNSEQQDRLLLCDT